MRRSKGFTIVELLVAFTILVLLVATAMGIVVAAVRVQSSSLDQQGAVEEASLVLEYMARALRNAKKDSGGVCLVTVGAGYTFEMIGTSGRVRFLDKGSVCREFYVSTGVLRERSSAGSSPVFVKDFRLLSDAVVLRDWWHATYGEFEGDAGSGNSDYVQPHITIALTIADENGEDDLISVQTTVTTRTLDVEE